MKILIVRLSSMGDIIHALPLASNAHRAGATVGWLADRPYRGLLESNPCVDRVFFADTRRWRRNPLRLQELAALSRSLREFTPDATIDAQGLWKSALLARLAGAPVVSFAARDRREPTSSLLVARPVRLGSSVSHAVDQTLCLLAPLGISVTQRAPDARYLVSRPNLEADTMLAAVPQPFALYHPGAGHPDKTWGEDRYAELARRLQAKEGLFPVLSWGPGDEKRRERLVALLPDALPVPRLDFSGLAHVIRQSSIFIAGDTGPLHLADALGVPTLALFGRSAPFRNLPTRNGPYRGTALSYDQTIAVETVAAKAAEILRRPARPFHAGTK